jgi:hypothetical protein
LLMPDRAVVAFIWVGEPQRPGTREQGPRRLRHRRSPTRYPSVLRTWLDRFDTQTVGLRGPTALANQAERSLYADQSTKAQAEPSAEAHADSDHHDNIPNSSATSGTDYKVNHSGSVYVFGLCCVVRSQAMPRRDLGPVLVRLWV